MIGKFGLEEAELPIGAFKTFQTKVAEIERLTGLKLAGSSEKTKTPRDCDSMNDGLPEAWRRRSPRR